MLEGHLKLDFVQVHQSLKVAISEVAMANNFSQFLPWLIVFGGMALLALLIDIGTVALGFRRWIDRRLTDVVGVATALGVKADALRQPHAGLQTVQGDLLYVRSSLSTLEADVNLRIGVVSDDLQRREASMKSLEASKSQLEVFVTAVRQTAANLESVEQASANGLARLQSRIGTQEEKVFDNAVSPTAGNANVIQPSSRSNRISGGVTVTIQTPGRVLSDGTRVDPTSVTILDAARLEVSDSSVLNPDRLFEDPVQADRIVTIDTASTLNDDGAVIGGTHVRAVDPVQFDMSRPEEVRPFKQGVLDWHRDQNR